MRQPDSTPAGVARTPAGALLFILCLIALTTIFVYDWRTTWRKPIIAQALAPEKADVPPPPAVIDTFRTLGNDCAACHKAYRD